MGVNKQIIVGNVGRFDPSKDVKAVGDGRVANFGVAVSSKWKNKKTGETDEHTEWFNIAAWEGLAGIVERFVHTGDEIYVEGETRTRSWEDNDTKETKYRTEVRATDIRLLRNGGKGGGSSNGSTPTTGSDLPF